jgi:hypothetical protein
LLQPATNNTVQAQIAIWEMARFITSLLFPKADSVAKCNSVMTRAKVIHENFVGHFETDAFFGLTGEAVHDEANTLGGNVVKAVIHSLALLLDEQCHETGNHDDKQDRRPNHTVITHPATAPATTIHHAALLRQRGARDQDGQGTNKHQVSKFRKRSSIDALDCVDLGV